MTDLRRVLVSVATVMAVALPATPAAAEATQQPQQDRNSETEVVPEQDDPEGIPLDWLLISYGIAALIGATGGFIYVDIVGPLRREPRDPRDRDSRVSSHQ